MAEPKTEHAITAFYSNGPGYEYLPTLDCSCGFSTGRCWNWAEAGEYMDEHIRELGDRA